MTSTEQVNGNTTEGRWTRNNGGELNLADLNLDQLDGAHSQDPEPDATSIFGAGNVPSPDKLRRAISLAEEALPLQRNETLHKVLSDEEFQEELEQQREFRADWREQEAQDHAARVAEHEQKRANKQKLANEQAAHEHAMAVEQQKSEQQQAKASRERDRLLDPNDEVRKAERAHRWLPKLALVPSAVAALVSAANLAIQGARIIEGPALAGAGVGIGIDLVFTVGLLAITLGRMSGVVTDGLKRRAMGSYIVGELTIGSGLAAASIIAHQLPSADGTPHNSSQAMWFVLLPFMFALSAIYGPKLQADTKARLVQASNHAQMSAPFGVLSDADTKVLRLTRWIADQDRQGLVPGERDQDGLPSVKGIERHVRSHALRCGNDLARQVRDTYALLQA